MTYDFQNFRLHDYPAIVYLGSCQSLTLHDILWHHFTCEFNFRGKKELALEEPKTFLCRLASYRLFIPEIHSNSIAISGWNHVFSLIDGHIRSPCHYVGPMLQAVTPLDLVPEPAISAESAAKKGPKGGPKGGPPPKGKGKGGLDWSCGKCRWWKTFNPL